MTEFSQTWEGLALIRSVYQMLWFSIDNSRDTARANVFKFVKKIKKAEASKRDIVVLVLTLLLFIHYSCKFDFNITTMLEPCKTQLSRCQTGSCFQ